ncbi:MAG: type II secretion system F family protein, partial [Planctomycetaceae bacterium]|nr:type II secretion system F family protein [Planctomycetaceae bacterium]
RRDVLRDLGTRTGVDDVRALAAVIIQAEKFGSSIGAALRVQSDGMRLKRRQLAEERAAKTAVKIMIPLVLFIFPGVFVVLVGPAGIQIAKLTQSSRWPCDLKRVPRFADQSACAVAQGSFDSLKLVSGGW